MTTGETITVESDWLPQAELDRLLAGVARQEPGVTTARAAHVGQRSLDPTIAVALITSAAALAAPFVAKIAERVFAKEPAATVSLVTTGGDAAALTAALSPEARDEIVRSALQSGAVTVRISIEPRRR